MATDADAHAGSSLTAWGFREQLQELWPPAPTNVGEVGGGLNIERERRVGADEGVVRRTRSGEDENQC